MTSLEYFFKVIVTVITFKLRFYVCDGIVDEYIGGVPDAICESVRSSRRSAYVGFISLGPSPRFEFDSICEVNPPEFTNVGKWPSRPKPVMLP